jgi:hypothetical protein
VHVRVFANLSKNFALILLQLFATLFLHFIPSHPSFLDEKQPKSGFAHFLSLFSLFPCFPNLLDCVVFCAYNVLLPGGRKLFTFGIKR